MIQSSKKEHAKRSSTKKWVQGPRCASKLDVCLFRAKKNDVTHAKKGRVSGKPLKPTISPLTKCQELLVCSPGMPCQILSYGMQQVGGGGQRQIEMYIKYALLATTSSQHAIRTKGVRSHLLQCRSREPYVIFYM
jgi:hypothetical protein